MSLFTKTVVVHGGLSTSDMRALEDAFTKIGDAARERLQGIDREIAELREEVAALKREQRMSIAQKIKAKGY